MRKRASVIMVFLGLFLLLGASLAHAEENGDDDNCRLYYV
jgi:hypothetical protein